MVFRLAQKHMARITHEADKKISSKAWLRISHFSENVVIIINATWSMFLYDAAVPFFLFFFCLEIPQLRVTALNLFIYIFVASSSTDVEKSLLEK